MGNGELEDVEIPAQFTHSVKLNYTAKGVRPDIHVYANDRKTAVSEAIAFLKDIKAELKKENIELAPFEIKEAKKNDS